MFEALESKERHPTLFCLVLGILIMSLYFVCIGGGVAWLLWIRDIIQNAFIEKYDLMELVPPPKNLMH